jgi:hypothetical protein
MNRSYNPVAYVSRSVNQLINPIIPLGTITPGDEDDKIEHRLRRCTAYSVLERFEEDLQYVYDRKVVVELDHKLFVLNPFWRKLDSMSQSS